jgi:hypothetical protein
MDKPIDINKALEALGGEKKIFYSMLGKFEQMILNKSMVEIAEAVN